MFECQALLCTITSIHRSYPTFPSALQNRQLLKVKSIKEKSILRFGVKFHSMLNIQHLLSLNNQLIEEENDFKAGEGLKRQLTVLFLHSISNSHNKTIRIIQQNINKEGCFC